MRGQAFNRWATSLGTCVSAATGKTAESRATQTRFRLRFLWACALQVMWQIVVDVQDTW